MNADTTRPTTTSTTTIRAARLLRPAAAALPLVSLLAAVGCARLDTTSQVDVKPIEVKPIHITVDVNVRVDRELDNFFAFQDEAAPAATQPATAPATAASPVTSPAPAN